MDTVNRQRPDWVDKASANGELFLDLRRYLRHGVEPLPDIEDTLKELRPCQVLHLACDREPVLLYPILEPMGFTHHADCDGKGWHVYFRKCS